MPAPTSLASWRTEEACWSGCVFTAPDPVWAAAPALVT